MVENFPNLGNEIDIQVQEVQRVPSKMSPKRTTPRHIIVKMVKVKGKERILKAAREKQLRMYKGNPIKLLVEFSTEILWARREWHDIIKVLKRKTFQPRILNLTRLSLRIEEEIKSFPDKQTLKVFITTKLALQEMLKEIL